MKNAVMLASIYREVFRTELDFSKFANRLKLQKMTYLLREMDVPCANYSYRWYQRGTYSQELQNDFLGSGVWNTEKVQLPEELSTKIATLKRIISENITFGYYTSDLWLEAISSCHYINNYMYGPGKDEDILTELQQLKPHLSNQQGNRAALIASKGITM